MGRSTLMLACIAAGGAACSEGAGDRLPIGALLPLTGTVSAAGQDHLMAVQLAVDEINDQGGVLGHSLQLVYADDHSDLERARMGAQSLITDQHVSVIIGALASDNTAVAETVTTPAQVVLLSGGSTAPSLTGSSPYFFRTCPSDALQGKLLAQRATKRQLGRVAVLHAPGSYGQGLADSFVLHFTASGGIVTSEAVVEFGQESYHDLLTAAFAGSPDGIVLVAYALEAAQVIRDYNSAFAFMPVVWFFTDSSQDSSFVQIVGGNNFTFTHEGTGTPLLDDDAYNTFAKAFMRRYARLPEGYSPNYYDATYLAALAMVAAGASDGPAVRAQLRNVADPGGLVVGPNSWAMGHDALTAGMDVNYEGASGSVDLDANGDVDGPYGIWRVVDGQIVPVERSVVP
jgi:ABC-type branched-subunit amino acid transport system substrate-binding protein